MDGYFFRLINGMAGESAFLDGIMIFMTDYAPYLFALVLMAMSVDWTSAKRRIGGWFTGVSLIIALGISYVIGQFWDRDRPFVTLEDVQVLVHHDADSGFPSDHTTAAFAIAFVLWNYNKKLGGVMLILAALIGLSRLFVGHHYPTDVLAGVVVGWIAAQAAKMIQSKVMKKSSRPASDHASG
ncbi:undecaprenyl-diphosphatase [Paludifilum halophilum]|uniref:Phosphatidic acid phosphatase type 2/haloperoxidase domain-containing protein n=1 Tax=Paludifilum halophilum TaxID=1642702 RepID=A0A235BD06_9BACL|nr:undecaprenyl-diphosphatase [Paludifilum halophilum]OYD09455.1 hypothetical protein CHM34_00040 [Paludifilum halophilum]